MVAVHEATPSQPLNLSQSTGTPMYVESCNGALRQACNKKRYHDYYHTTGPSNYVTLLRQPIEHAISGLSYTNKLRASSGQEPMSVTDYVALISNIHVKVRQMQRVRRVAWDGWRGVAWG
jgi:hypothetical protein